MEEGEGNNKGNATEQVNRKATVKMGYTPYRTPLAERVSTSRPDADLNLVDGNPTLRERVSRTGKTSWADIVMPEEYKKRNRLQDEQDVRVDSIIPSPRFSYLITIRTTAKYSGVVCRSSVMTPVGNLHMGSPSKTPQLACGTFLVHKPMFRSHSISFP